MHARNITIVLILLALSLPASPAHAGGLVTVCDESHLRAALDGGGAVSFACSGMIILTDEIVISADTTIDGKGHNVIISGNHHTRVFFVNGAGLALNELVIINGFAQEGGGVFLFDGTLTVTNCHFSGNKAFNPFFAGGGAILSAYGSVTVIDSSFAHNSGYGGGAIMSYETLTVANSTFLHNQAPAGGAIMNAGELTLSNSTFHDNRANSGGAIFSVEGPATVTNSTFSANGTTNPTCHPACSGGNILNSDGTLTVYNTIIANSLTETGCSGNIADGGGNISFPDVTCPGANADPTLGRLQDNGGPTETMALGPGSAAIDRGNDIICAAAPVSGFDQRGVKRPQGTRCDIGAVEQLLPRMWLPALHKSPRS